MVSEVAGGGGVQGLVGQHLTCGVRTNSRQLASELLGVENPHIC